MGDNLFVQVGATRDGLDPYLLSAKKMRINTVLVETSHYLNLRKKLKRQKFDFEIPIQNPSDVTELANKLGSIKKNIVLMLPGFDRYVEAAYLVAKNFQVLPWRNKEYFLPPDKDKQRVLLEICKNVAQPKYQIIDLSEVSKELDIQIDYPLVVKPTNGAGGLGIYLVNSKDELLATLHVLKNMTNYDGTFFKKIILEEFITGLEMSVQGVYSKEQISILGFCEKIIKLTLVNQNNNIKDFREVGHIACCGDELAASLLEFVTTTLATLNYKEGPFHIDFIVTQNGIYFLEAGFRLSGGAIVSLVQKISGVNWASATFDIFFDKQYKNSDFLHKSNKLYKYIGLTNLHTPKALDRAKSLSKKNHEIEIQTFDINGQMIAARNKDLSTSLTADMLRHGSTLGRMWVYGNEKINIENIIKNTHEI